MFCSLHQAEWQYDNRHDELVFSIQHGPTIRDRFLKHGVDKALGTRPKGVAKAKWEQLKEHTVAGIRDQGWVK